MPGVSTERRGRLLGIAVRCIGLCGLALIALGQTPVLAQAPPLPADVTAILSRVGGATTEEVAALQAGRVVVRTQVAAEDLEASVVSAVHIATTPDRTLSYFRQLLSYVDGQATLQYGAFTQPAVEGDVQALTLEPADISDLQACQPSTCEVRVGAASVEDIRGAVDWRAPDVMERASAWLRRGLVSFVNAYLQRGDASLRAYDDRAKPIDVGEQWRAMLERAPLPSAVAPGLQRYLAAFPAAKVPEATDEVYWDKQHFIGLKPVVGVTHLVTWREAAHPERVIVAQKQIQASRYFFASLGVTLIAQDTATPPGTWVVYTNRTRGDLLRGTQSPTQTGLRARVNSIAASLQRRAGEQMVRQSAERLMNAMKEALER